MTLLKSKRVLNLARQPCARSAEIEPAVSLLQPALIEDQKQIVARTNNPPHAALPAQVARFVVELHEIGDGKKRREGIVGAQLENPRDEVAFLEPDESLIQSQPDLKMRRDLVTEPGLELIGVTGVKTSEPPREIDLPAALRRGIEFKAPARETIIARW